MWVLFAILLAICVGLMLVVFRQQDRITELTNVIRRLTDINNYDNYN